MLGEESRGGTVRKITLGTLSPSAAKDADTDKIRLGFSQEYRCGD